MVSKKMKKITLPPPSSSPQPILSLRSTRMTKMKSISSDHLASLLFSFFPKAKTEMTLDELRDDISRYQRTNRFITCGYVMGVSCAGTDRYDEDTPKTQENFEKQTVYGKWRMAGGRCREFANAYSSVDSDAWDIDEKCSSRCKGSTNSGTYECKCSLLANGQPEC